MLHADSPVRPHARCRHEPAPPVALARVSPGAASRLPRPVDPVRQAAELRAAFRGRRAHRAAARRGALPRARAAQRARHPAQPRLGLALLDRAPVRSRRRIVPAACFLAHPRQPDPSQLDRDRAAGARRPAHRGSARATDTALGRLVDRRVVSRSDRCRAAAFARARSHPAATAGCRGAHRHHAQPCSRASSSSCRPAWSRPTRPTSAGSSPPDASRRAASSSSRCDRAIPRA